jgi:NAD(P)-dependent dehydrogenase (short-subunit alcohol dehydrogenase family)
MESPHLHFYTNRPGSRGIGLHIATTFLRAGAKSVFITARKAPGVEQAVAQLNALPGIKGKAIGIPGSAAETDEIQALVDKVKEIEPKLDILVANAGATWGGPFEMSPDWASKKVVDLNVRGVFNLVRLYAVPGPDHHGPN